jgi:hypothetical protein
MYPADLLGSTYGANDLPDAVTVNWTDRFTGSMSKSGSGYAGGGATLQIVNGIWRLSDSDGTRNVGRCLIRGDGNLTPDDDLVEDQFADEYRVVSTTEEYVFDEVVTRYSLCSWGIFYGGSEEEGFNTSRYLLFFDDLNQKWFINGQSSSGNLLNGFGGGVKTQDQNAPEGTYDGKFQYVFFGPEEFDDVLVTVTAL